MTASLSPIAAETPLSFCPYTLPLRKGFWLARVLGRDEKYGLCRDFDGAATGRTTVTGGGKWIQAFALRPGWYEAQHGWQGRTFLGVWPGDVEPRPVPVDAVVMVRIAEGPNPGEPGAWSGDECACGAPVERFDRDGFPFCDKHFPNTDGEAGDV